MFDLLTFSVDTRSMMTDHDRTVYVEIEEDAMTYPMMLHTDVCDEFDAYVADNRDLFDWVAVSTAIDDDLDMLATGALPSEL